MISAYGLNLRIGARELLVDANFRIDKGMRIGLVGRNGAGKTTLTRVLAQQTEAIQAVEVTGNITRSGDIGYLPQDPKAGDMEQNAMGRILEARDLAQTIKRIKKAEWEMSNLDGSRQQKAMERYVRLDHEFTVAGGWAAQAEASQMAAALGITATQLKQPIRTLSGGQRRRVELARILFSQAPTLLLDEPTNHLDHDSIIWLREYLRNYKGGFVVISHSVELLDDTVNQVWHIDANRAALDVYSMGWKSYLVQRQSDEKRRRQERANAEKKASTILAQAAKIGAKATKAAAAHNMVRRAEDMLNKTENVRQEDKVAKIRFPTPAPCGKVPLQATNISVNYGSLEVFSGVDLAIDRGSKVVVLGFNGAGKTTLLRVLAGLVSASSGEVVPGHGLKLGYYAQEHETLDIEKTVAENMMSVAAELNDTQLRSVIGQFLFVEDDVFKKASVLSGGEKTRLAIAMIVVSAANVLILDEPTNNLDPASREEILQALTKYEGAVVLVTHDMGAVQALKPERVLILPDGDEDLWSDEYIEIVSLV